MKVTNREAVLGWVVGLLILISLSYWFGAPKVRIWQEIVESQKQLANRITLSERLIQQQGKLTARLDSLKTKLSKYEAAKDVTADYLKILERVAKDSNVNLVQRRPQKEKRHGDLYELAIDCTWEGNLEGLVRFLYALEHENVTMDVGELTVSVPSGGKGPIKGNFALMCVYSRSGVPPAPDSKEKTAAPKSPKS